MSNQLKKVTLTSMFAALCFVLTMFVKVPVASGYVHFGDAVIYCCAAILGAPYGMLAGAIGAGLADVAGGFAVYAPASVIIKALIALPFGLLAKRQEKILSVKTALMTLPAGGITVGGYFLADLVIDASYAVVDIPGNVIQAVGSAVLFLVMAFAMDKGRLKPRMTAS